MLYTIGDHEYADELIKLGFSRNLCTRPEHCEDYLKYCRENNMKFLKGSYGTIVHEDFDKYFKKSRSHKIQDKLECRDMYGYTTTNVHFDHVNLFKSKIVGNTYVLTSSPYAQLNVDEFKELKSYPYSVYVINPKFLDYHIFVTGDNSDRHPLDELNYLFTDASAAVMYTINKQIWQDLGFKAFVQIKEREML